MRSLPYFLFDVFAEEPFGGNPLAVFPDADGVPTELMQKIANELNLSETTFIQAATNAGSDCTIRIFTPKSEIPMAGHPTIGTAHAILANRLLTPINDTFLVFDEGVGPVTVDYQLRDGSPESLCMHQGLPEFSEPLDRSAYARVLSLEGNDLMPDLPVQTVSCGFPFAIVPARSLDAVGKVRLQLDALEKLPTQEILVFTRETEKQGFDIHCRMFAPRLGVPEDPATGGAHGPIGSYLVAHGLSDGKRIVSEQGCEMGRPSKIVVEITTEGREINDVVVEGKCIAMGRGTLEL